MLVPYPGIQYDEALFAVPIYSGVAHELKMRAFHHDIPLMLMTYLGASKTWLFELIFRLWAPGVWSLRLPTVLIGAATLPVLYILLRKAAGLRLALCACLLLATDAAYILTTTFDWGPVAIQHLAWTTGVALILSAYRNQRPLRFATGFLMFGLAMWDKAIFIWMLSGTVLAALLLFHREIRRAFTPRNAVAAVLGFGIGATPLIIYNIRNPLQTFQGNAVFSTEELAGKLITARSTLNGGSLFGYLVNEEMTEAPKQPRGALERFAVVLREWAGVRRADLLDYALLIAVLAVPLWWTNRRLVLFSIIVMAVAWPQMLFTRNAGGGAHHIVLLWPLPHIVIAAALAGIAERLRRGGTVACSTLLAALTMANLLVVNQYLVQFIRNGPTNIWTDAISPLSEFLTPYESRPVFIPEWGADTTLRMLHEGRFQRLWSLDDASLPAALGIRDALYVTHTPSYEIQPGTSKRLFQEAERRGYRRQLVATIPDSNGRPIFEVSELQKSGAPATR